MANHLNSIKRHLCILFLSLSIIAISLPLHAKTFVGYVSDNLTTVLYANPDLDASIIAYLDAGQKIHIIAVNNESWNQIRLEDGKVGWIESQHITSTPGRQQQIFTLKKEQLSLQTELAANKKEAAFLQEEITKYRQQNLNLKKQIFNQQSKLTRYEEILADPLKINQENLRLKKNIEFLKFDNSVLQRSTQDIHERNQSEWQTLVIIFSIIFLLLGYIIGKRLAENKRAFWKNL